MKHILLATFVLISFTACNEVFKDEQVAEKPVWIAQASAPRQCVPPTFTSLEEAISQLKENDIEVLNSNEKNFIVCAACTCPTGIVYEALISSKDLAKAEELGWSPADEDDELAE